MATTVYDVEEIELQSGAKVKLKPLSIKQLRKFMEVIKKDFELVFANFDENRDVSIEVKKVK